MLAPEFQGLGCNSGLLLSPGEGTVALVPQTPLNTPVLPVVPASSRAQTRELAGGAEAGAHRHGRSMSTGSQHNHAVTFRIQSLHMIRWRNQLGRSEMFCPGNLEPSKKR